MIRPLFGLALTIASFTAHASVKDWAWDHTRSGRTLFARIARALSWQQRLIPQIAIYPCGNDYSCVHVDTDVKTMTPRTGLTHVEGILATADDGPDARLALIRTTLGRHPVLVLYRVSEKDKRGEILGFSHDTPEQRHPSAEDLAAHVKVDAFRAYLASSFESEPALAAALLEVVKADRFTMLSLQIDLRNLNTQNLFDSQMKGKIQRLQDRMNALGGIVESPALEASDRIHALEKELNRGYGTIGFY